jgi:hypothetical protein
VFGVALLVALTCGCSGSRPNDVPSSISSANTGAVDDQVGRLRAQLNTTFGAERVTGTGLTNGVLSVSFLLGGSPTEPQIARRTKQDIATIVQTSLASSVPFRQLTVSGRGAVMNANGQPSTDIDVEFRRDVIEHINWQTFDIETIYSLTTGSVLLVPPELR